MRRLKNPPHPGDLIRTEIIEALGLSLTKAAEILKVRRATLSDLVHGKAALTPEMALRIEKAFGPDTNHLLCMQRAYDVARAAAIEEATAGIRELQKRTKKVTVKELLAWRHEGHKY